MSITGFKVSEEVKAAFVAFTTNADLFSLEVGIANETFVVRSELKNAGDGAGNFTSVANKINELGTEPAYFVSKDPNTADKILLIFYCSDSAKVRSRMTYASSINALKDGLGSSNFIKDYHISLQNEAAYDVYLNDIGEIDNRELMTLMEFEAHEAEMESNKMGGRGVGNAAAAVVSKLPIKVADGVNDALQGVAATAGTAVVLALHMQTEVLSKVNDVAATCDAVVGVFPDREPRFVVMNYDHSDRDGKAGNAAVLVYYCPEYAKPREKMFYSTSLSIVKQLCTDNGITTVKRYEISEKNELSDAYLLDELYPVVEKKVVQKKAKMIGKRKGKSRMTNKIKFNAGS